MKENNSTISSNKFTLGEGPDGVYSDLTVEIRKSDTASINRGPDIQLQNEAVLKAIEKEFLSNWIEEYKKAGIYLEVTILHVGIDSTGRQYKVDNSVGGVMRDALPKIGVQPPEIFGL